MHVNSTLLCIPSPAFPMEWLRLGHLVCCLAGLHKEVKRLCFASAVQMAELATMTEMVATVEKVADDACAATGTKGLQLIGQQAVAVIKQAHYDALAEIEKARLDAIAQQQVRPHYPLPHRHGVPMRPYEWASSCYGDQL